MDYSKYYTKTLSKLTKYGSTCKLVKTVGQVYEPSTNEYKNVNEIVEGKAILSTFDIEMVNGTSIQNGDISLLCCFPERPVNNNNIVFGDKTYIVVSVNPCNIDGKTDIFYEVQAR